MILHYDHYRTGQRKRGARTILIPVISVVLVIAIVLVLALHVPSRLFGGGAVRQAPGRLPDLWKAGQYEAVIAAADSILREDPLSPAALTYRGFASFYRAVTESAGEERSALLDQTILSLRRARLVATPFGGEADYVLGKAYFLKGKYYYDLAISSMESSLAKGYEQKDSNQYIGVAYAQLGEYEKALGYFLTALKADTSDMLLLTIGLTYYQMKRSNDAVDYFLRTLNKTQDKGIEEQARFKLAEIYSDRGDLFKAEEQLLAIARIDSRSADAHYQLGEVYAKMNDPVRARAEWRNALIIDPSHYGAKLRYYPAKR